MRKLRGNMDHQEIAARLAAPFPAERHKFKPKAVTGQRALPVVYIDARDVMDRLDEVLGAFGWKDEYRPQADGSVICLLSIREAGGEWITKQDIGKAGGDIEKAKSGFSDAFKRAAVKFGIGRYIYRIKPDWTDYDPQKKCFKTPPKLDLPGVAKATKAPAAAKPAVAPAAPAAAPPAPAAPASQANGKATEAQLVELKTLGEAFKLDGPAWVKICAKRGVNNRADLTSEQATEIIGNMRSRLVSFPPQEALAADGLPAPAREPAFRSAPVAGGSG